MIELDPVIRSRIQFAFVVGFHIIFPAFTIGLAAWLATIEGMRLATGNLVDSWPSAPGRSKVPRLGSECDARREQCAETA